MSDITERLTVAIADRYVIERELGAGGMATVYLAHDVKHDRKVALKVLRPELAAVIGAERFLQEIKVTANLQHSHILPLYDSGAAEGFLYYVMPYVEGETLRTKLTKEKQLAVDDAIALTRGIAGALEHAHKQGVVHRDIKPENILLRDNDPLVADFGIALAVSHAGGHRLTETGLSIGTPHYMSPEQAMGDRELDARSDVYSLGAVLYEMLTGEPPYTGSTAQAIVARVITEEPRSITLQRRTVPPHVADAVHKALNKLPADRFSSAASFAEALITPGYATPSHTRAGTAAVAVPRRDRRVMGLVAMLVVMTGLAAWGLLRAEPAPASLRMRVAIASHPVPPGLVGRHLALSPDGRTIVFSDTVGGTRQLWIKTPDRAEAAPLSGTQNGRAPTFSPDGQWIAFVAEGRIRKVPVTGGAAVTVGDSAETNNVPSVAWLDNGTIAYGDVRFGVRVVGQDGGLRHRVDAVGTVGMGVVAIDPLPGGEAVLLGLCTFGCPTTRLGVLHIASGTIDSLADGALRGWHVGNGLVAYARQDGGVLAGPFDVGRRRFREPPIPVLEGVQSTATEADMVIAADGTLLFVPGAATVAARVEVVWVARDGRVTPVDSGWSFSPSSNGGIRLSPDDGRLAVAIQSAGAEDIWIKELDRGPFTRLTFEGVNTRPEWSPDGRYLMFFTGGVQEGNLLRRRSDGTGGTETILDIERAVWEVQQPPGDTSALIVRLGVPPTRDIYLLRRGAGADSIVPLIASDRYEETSIALSPDGRWLAYTSNESGRYEVYVRPFPDVAEGRWQVSGNGGTEPRWAHSGLELFYRNGASDLISTEILPGSGFRYGTQRVLFSTQPFMSNAAYPDYDLTSDDQRFLFKRIIRSEGEIDLANTAVLVLDWLTDLRVTGVGGR